jgi:hypothetical protein
VRSSARLHTKFCVLLLGVLACGDGSTRRNGREDAGQMDGGSPGTQDGSPGAQDGSPGAQDGSIDAAPLGKCAMSEDGTLTVQKQHITINDMDDVRALSGCTDVKNLSIVGDKVTSLRALRGLHVVDGLLEILRTGLTSLEGLDGVSFAGTILIDENPVLETVAGLGNLTATWDLTMGKDARTSVCKPPELSPGNPALRRVEGFTNLKSIKGTLTIAGNAVLDSVAGFASLESIGGDFRVAGNPLLTNLDGFSRTVTVKRDFVVSDNAKLTTLSGLERVKIKEIVGESYHDVVVARNKSLKSVTGLHNLALRAGLLIEGNPELTSLADLAGVPHLRDYLFIRDNDSLTQLSGLDAVDGIEGSLCIEGNAKLASLQGLGAVGEVHGHLRVVDNALLQNIDALGALTDLGESSYTPRNPCGGEGGEPNDPQIYITDNPSLYSVAGLGSLVGRTDISIYILRNQALTTFGSWKLARAHWFYVQDNAALKSLSGLESLAHVSEDLSIARNASLESLTGLDGLEYTVIATILQNPKLINLRGLGALTEVFETLRIMDNANLATLDGLENLTAV